MKGVEPLKVGYESTCVTVRPPRCLVIIGRADRVRTGDIHVGNVTLYPTELLPQGL